jgi:hypothetical protein
VKPTAGVRSAADAEVLAIDQQRLGPPIGQLPGAHQVAPTSTQVGDQLPLVGHLSPTAPASGLRHPARLLARELGRHAIARPPRNRRQRLADLPRREPILPRARLTLPRLQPRRALHAIRMRLPLARQDRCEPMLGISVDRSTPPPLTPMRRPAIPTTPHHPRSGVLRDRTLRNLHRPATLSLDPDVSTQIE